MANVSNVTAGKPKVGGAIFVAPYGTTLPTDATTALAEGFASLGYCSEDGLTNDTNIDTASIKAWGGDTVLVTRTGKDDTFSYTLIEALNVEVLKHVYGAANVTGDLETGLTVKANATEPAAQSMVIDVIMRDDAIRRIVIPYAKVTEIGTITYVDDEAVGYEMTVSASPDAENNTHYEYTVRPTATTPGEGDEEPEG